MSYDHLAPSLQKVVPSSLALPGEVTITVLPVVDEEDLPQVHPTVPVPQRKASTASRREDLLARRESILKRRHVGHNNPMARILGYASIRRQGRAF